MAWWLKRLRVTCLMLGAMLRSLLLVGQHVGHDRVLIGHLYWSPIESSLCLANGDWRCMNHGPDDGGFADD